jgi:hypothetical protein
MMYSRWKIDVGLHPECGQIAAAVTQRQATWRRAITATVEHGWFCVMVEQWGDYVSFVSAPVGDAVALEWLVRWILDPDCELRSSPPSVRSFGFDETGADIPTDEDAELDSQRFDSGMSYLFGGQRPAGFGLKPLKLLNDYCREAHQSHCCDADCGGCA